MILLFLNSKKKIFSIEVFQDFLSHSKYFPYQHQIKIVTILNFSLSSCEKLRYLVKIVTKIDREIC